jgi:hypothetical protein
MTKLVDNTSRGDFYTAPWNYKAFEDPSADRYWLLLKSNGPNSISKDAL